MSSNMMNTEPGGESTQYESIETVDKPHAKQGGQMGEPETVSQTSTTTPQDLAKKGAKAAENIRYGQTISEGGMSGQTTTSSGQANTEVGFGGTREDVGGDETAAHSRRAAGYGGANDMKNDVGA